uniref:C2 domain-containing protein n=1 Tax=Gouania willdenowi TaxID=441366 RepID=A0A8C5HV54_GOUWI
MGMAACSHVHLVCEIRLKMKFAVIAALLATVFIQNSVASSCYGKNVEVTVINGIGMTGDGLSRPDPYVKVTIGDITKKTKVIRSTRNPVWWQGFSFKNINSNEMRIEVWDQDSGLRGGDDHIGTLLKLNPSVFNCLNMSVFFFICLIYFLSTK